MLCRLLLRICRLSELCELIGHGRRHAKALEISDALGIGGVTLPVDGGLIWLKRGSPFCQALADDTDKNLKRRYINVTAEFLCLN